MRYVAELSSQVPKGYDPLDCFEVVDRERPHRPMARLCQAADARKIAAALNHIPTGE